MKKVRLVVGIVGILALTIAPAIAQVPEGYVKYEIQPHDSLWKISKKILVGADNETLIDAVEILRDINGLENPHLIHPYTELWVPESAESFGKRIAEKHVVLEKEGVSPEKRAPPAEDVIAMFIQLWNSRTAAVKEVGGHIDKLTEAVNQLVKSEELERKLAEVENLLNEQATMFEETINENHSLRTEVAELQGVKNRNRWLLLLMLIGWGLFVAFLIGAVVLGRSLRTEKDRNEDLKAENEILKREKNQLEKEKEKLKGFIPGNEVKMEAEKDGEKVEAYCRITGTEEKEGKVRRKLVCPYCNIEVWEENMARHWKKSCEKGPFPQIKKGGR